MAAAGGRLARVPSLLLRSRPRAPFPDIAVAVPSSGHVLRMPATVRFLASMVPLHCAIASSRLVSVLSAESQSWGLIPQGISMPL